MRRVTMYPSRVRCSLLLLVSGLITAGGVAALVSAGGELDVGAGAVGIVFTAFFSLCTASYLWRLLSGRPVLVLDERGIGNATSIGGTKHLPWADMTSSARSARSRRRTWT